MEKDNYILENAIIMAVVSKYILDKIKQDVDKYNDW